MKRGEREKKSRRWRKKLRNCEQTEGDTNARKEGR